MPFPAVNAKDACMDNKPLKRYISGDIIISGKRKNKL